MCDSQGRGRQRVLVCKGLFLQGSPGAGDRRKSFFFSAPELFPTACASHHRNFLLIGQQTRRVPKGNANDGEHLRTDSDLRDDLIGREVDLMRAAEDSCPLPTFSAPKSEMISDWLDGRDAKVHQTSSSKTSEAISPTRSIRNLCFIFFCF